MKLTLDQVAYRNLYKVRIDFFLVILQQTDRNYIKDIEKVDILDILRRIGI